MIQISNWLSATGRRALPCFPKRTGDLLDPDGVVLDYHFFIMHTIDTDSAQCLLYLLRGGRKGECGLCHDPGGVLAQVGDNSGKFHIVTGSGLS